MLNVRHFFYIMFNVTVQPEINDSKNFSKNYKEIAHVYFHNRLETRKRKYVGRKNSTQKCAICHKQSPEAKFTQDCHTIPASLGNTIFFTKEECNECNSKLGSTTEDALANMFITNRIIGHVKGRKFPKITSANGDKFGINATTGGLELITKEGGDIKINRSNNSISIQIPTTKFKPYDALRGILKSAWFHLPQKDRENLPEMLSCIIDTSIETIDAYFATLPGNGYEHTTLQIFKSKKKKNKKFSYVIVFKFVNVIVYWFSDKLQSEHNFPKIQFKHYDDRGQVKIALHNLTKDKMWGGNRDLAFHFKEMKKIETPTDVPKISIPKPDLKRQFILKVDDIELSTQVKIIRWDDEIWDIEIFGGELGAEIKYLKNRITKFEDYSLSLNFPSIPIENLEKTFQFLDAITKSSCRIEFFHEDKSLFILKSKDVNLPINVQSARETTKAIIAINREFNLNLRYPAKVINSEFENIETLGNAIRLGEFTYTHDQPKQFTLRSQNATSFDKPLPSNIEFSMDFTAHYKILGHSFGPFVGTLKIGNVKLLSKSNQGKNFKYIFAYKRESYNFPEFLVKINKA